MFWLRRLDLKALVEATSNKTIVVDLLNALFLWDKKTKENKLRLGNPEYFTRKTPFFWKLRAIYFQIVRTRGREVEMYFCCVVTPPNLQIKFKLLDIKKKILQFFYYFLFNAFNWNYKTQEFLWFCFSNCQFYFLPLH